MSDLISRSEVIEELNKYEKELRKDRIDAIETDDENMLFAIANQLTAICRIKRNIMNMPTAYSVDKVVAKLKKIEQHCLDMSDWQGQSAMYDAIEIVKQGSVAADVLEENRTNIPANDNPEDTEEYKINWPEMKYTSYEELLSFLISNEGDEDLIGKIRVGDICIDVINHPEVEKIFFDFYVLHEDTGYGFSKGIPYSYADDFSISYNDIYVAMKQNQSMMENIEKKIENHIRTFASNQYSLMEHAKRELVIW